MNWKLTTAGKIRAIASLAVVFLLVLATNLMDNHHFRVVKRSLETVYKDRLVAKDHLYKISRQLQLKKDILASDDRAEIFALNNQSNDSIEVLIEKFAATELTKLESSHFKSLHNDLQKLYALEKELPNRTNDPQVINLSKEVSLMSNIQDHYLRIFNDLDVLSQIQLDEGRRMIFLSNRAVDTSDLISRIEIGALIALGIIIQFLIFYKPWK